DPQTPGDDGDSTTAPAGRDVKILPVLQDGSGEGPSTCVGPWPDPSPAPPGSCGFDRNDPVATIRADALSVEGLADALAEALREIPIEGEITLVPHSQGGFLARALLHRHYDDLRWQGRKISRVITLGHPYLGVLADPSLVAAWSCFGFSGSYKNCQVPRWLWGWQSSLSGDSGYTIDDAEFPQIQWSAIAGHETGDDHASTFNFPAACIEVFGGVDNAQTDGDGTVPIQSSLGIDEHDFYPFAALDFDAAIQTPCGHEPYCQLENAVTSLGDGLLPRAAERESHGTLTFGGSQQVAVTDPIALSALTATNAFSLEAWVRPDDDAQNVVILSKGGEYRLEYASDRSFHITLNGFWGGDFVGFGSDIPLRAWTHVAVTHANGVLRGYVNGELAVEETGGPLVDDDPVHEEFRIGGTEDGSLASMVGSIDDVRVWTRALTQAEIRIGMGGFDARKLNATGLRAWWKFDEPEGDTLIDSKLVGTTFFDVSLSDFPSAPWRWGAAREIEKGALYFDGIDDRVFFQDPVSTAALTMTDGLTLEAWIHPRDDEPGVIFQKAGEYQLIRRFDGTLAYSLASASPGYTERLTGAAIPSRTWTHVALTFGGSAAAVFVNGERIFIESTTGPLGDVDPIRNQLSIGAPVVSTFPPSAFNGLIDEVRIWDRARSIAQIRNGLFRAIDPSDPTTQGLVASWRFNEQATELVLDAAADRHGRRGQIYIDPADNTEKPVRSTNQTVPEPTRALGIAAGGLLLAARARRARRTRPELAMPRPLPDTTTRPGSVGIPVADLFGIGMAGGLGIVAVRVGLGLARIVTIRVAREH
ncbi:MAG: LamG-like jellyroll fold domain-containing protein, partial [Myxococcota bacterium]